MKTQWLYHNIVVTVDLIKNIPMPVNESGVERHKFLNIAKQISIQFIYFYLEH